METTTSPEVTVTSNSEVATTGTEYDEQLFIGAISGGVPAGILLVLLLVTLCVLVPVLVRRVKYRQNTTSLSLQQTNPITGTSTDDTDKPPEHELKKNIAYVPTNILTATNDAYLSAGKEAASTLNDEYTYAPVPDQVQQDRVAYSPGKEVINTMSNDAYIPTVPEPTEHEVKQNVAYSPGKEVISTMPNDAYIVVVPEPTEDEVKQNVAYVPIDNPTVTSLSVGKQAISTAPHDVSHML